MKQTSFLNYYQTILAKVSFDPALLKKEYNKALNILHPDEQASLKTWVAENGLDQAMEELSLVEVGV